MKNKIYDMNDLRLFEEFTEELGDYLKYVTDIDVECGVEYEAIEKIINVTINIYGQKR